MADLNKVMLIGRLTRDPQLKYLPSGGAVCEFGFAVGRKYKLASGEEREESTFVDCTIFAKGGETFNQYMKKGSQAYIEGRLKLDQWDDKTTGQKRSKLSVVVENFQFLGGRGEGGGGDAGAASRPPAARPQIKASPEHASPPFDEQSSDKDANPGEDIPF